MKQSFTPVRVGRYTLPNRLVMAPMTRSRAKVDGTPGELAAVLLPTRQRRPDRRRRHSALGRRPGLYTPAHVAGWKKVTRAVHDKGGRIFIQIMHAGRMSRQPVAPSAIAPGAPMFTAAGMQDIPAPRALTTEEVRRTVTDFRLAARSTIKAGADGVEVHRATGYLIRQFFA
jgi:N-ethylmaleimide reductase